MQLYTNAKIEYLGHPAFSQIAADIVFWGKCSVITYGYEH